MLLIAVTGPVGAGKTTLLATLAAWSRAQGRPADGFVSRAVRRFQPHMGAAGYDLEWVRDGTTRRFASRTGRGVPAYTFSDQALVEARDWARRLRDEPPRPLVVLDEFGRLEAAGGGHVLLWPDLVAAAPDIVVLSVREGLVETIAGQLGRPFDLVVDARSPDAWERLRAACREHEDWQRVGTYGAGAGSIEVGLGSALHGLHVPGRGMILSGLQAAVMTAAGSGLGRRRRVVWVPFISAGLKALSPAGSRLRPMLAITIQGLLFSGATSLLGWNVLGVAVGGWLVGAWAAAQGIALQYLLVGDDLLRAYTFLTDWLTRHLGIAHPAVGAAIAGWIGLGGLVAMAAALHVHRRRELPARFRELMARRLEGLAEIDAPPSRTRALQEGLRDLARPVFWLPLAVIGTVVLAAGARWEELFWMILRAVTVGFVLFSLARSFRPRRLVGWLRERGHWGPALALERALRREDREES